ncbi:MAG: primosomal protein N' [Campylobacter sp.]|nr:primosomal protein N' [Campylobacter sp.]
MHYYKVSLNGKNLPSLTYQSDVFIAPYTAVIVPVLNKPNLAYVIKECEKPEFKTLEISEILDLKLNKFQELLAEFISYYYTCKLGISLNLFEASSGETQIKKSTFGQMPKLSENQNLALDFTQKHKISLIFGDTGSGKSEIYICAIEKILSKDKQALLLMPEISLTPQMQKRLEKYFGSAVAIWHSKVSKKRKSEILQGLKSGDIKLIAGARSALFLPLDRLALIVVDEEHDDSYKSTGSKPHYNARDLAIYLASKFDIKIILGSATPSINTVYKQPTFRLKGTFFESKKTYIFDESQRGLSQRIKSEILKSLTAKKQAVVFLPTRANFKFMLCKNCGEIIKCPFCSVGMSYYKKENVLKCQYCELKLPVPKLCDTCQSEMIEAKKIGTSELVAELSEEFATARIAKFDRDDITTQAKLVKTLKDFNDGKIDILVGTQMLSKGHDYHNVDLAVIMGADELLAYPEYKAREKTLALAMQVAGRAGRAGEGRVVIQSQQREFFEAFLNDYDSFIEDEKAFRDPLYPPFVRMLRLLISHKNDTSAKKELDSKVQIIKELNLNVKIIGYGKCGIERLHDKFRYEILLRSTSYTALIKIANACISKFCDADMDPISFS